LDKRYDCFFYLTKTLTSQWSLEIKNNFKKKNESYAFFASQLQSGPHVHTPVDLQSQSDLMHPSGEHPHPIVQISNSSI